MIAMASQFRDLSLFEICRRLPWHIESRFLNLAFIYRFDPNHVLNRVQGVFEV